MRMNTPLKIQSIMVVIRLIGSNVSARGEAQRGTDVGVHVLHARERFVTTWSQVIETARDVEANMARSGLKLAKNIDSWLSEYPSLPL
jgi:hypothetical protein